MSNSVKQELLKMLQLKLDSLKNGGPEAVPIVLGKEGVQILVDLLRQSAKIKYWLNFGSRRHVLDKLEVETFEVDEGDRLAVVEFRKRVRENAYPGYSDHRATRRLFEVVRVEEGCSTVAIEENFESVVMGQ